MTGQPVFVCLDLQRGFIETGPLRAPYAAEALLESARLLALARQQRWSVVHCLLRRAVGAVRIDDEQARPASGFGPLSSEAVIERETLSAYGHSAFAALLEAAPYKTALVAGLSASLTFIATAIDAFERGHRLVIAADAFAGQEGAEASAHEHEAVARDIAAQLGFPAARMDGALIEPRPRISFKGERHGGR